MATKTKTTIVKEDSVDDENTPGAKIAVLRNEVRHVNETLNRVELKIDNMALNFVTASQLKAAEDAALVKHLEQDRRILSLESWNEWAIRIVLGLVVSAVIGTVLVTKGIA